MIKNIKDLQKVVIDRISELEHINLEYLNESGLAAREAYRAVAWHAGFHPTLESLANDEQFQSLVSIPNKHPEYYKIIRMINRAIFKSLQRG